MTMNTVGAVYEGVRGINWASSFLGILEDELNDAQRLERASLEVELLSNPDLAAAGRHVLLCMRSLGEIVADAFPPGADSQAYYSKRMAALVVAMDVVWTAVEGRLDVAGPAAMPSAQPC
jgi:hypothetical protein